jgi:hypothetical protein
MATPHDTLFDYTFKHARHTAAWLRSFLPALVVAMLDWDSLHPADTKVHGQPLRLFTSDRVFAARLLVGGLDACVLIEHKSYEDENLLEQLVLYSVNVSHGGGTGATGAGIVPVVPVVLYHGRRPWHEVRMRERFPRLPADVLSLLQPTQPTLCPFVDDLSQYTEAGLRVRELTPLALLTLLCLRFLRTFGPDEVLAAIDRWGDLLRLVDRDAGLPVGGDAVAKIGWYVLHVTELPATLIHMAFQRNLERPEETIMSTAEKLRAEGRIEGRKEGRKEGRNEGRNEGRTEVLQRLLERRFGPLPLVVTARLAAATTGELEQWTDRLLDAPSLADVFGDGPG